VLRRLLNPLHRGVLEERRAPSPRKCAALLVALYRLPRQNLQPSYNVCPTDPVDVILPKEGGGHDFARMRWCSVPYWWAKPLKQVPATFNARSDTVATKPIFRDA